MRQKFPHAIIVAERRKGIYGVLINEAERGGWAQEKGRKEREGYGVEG